MSTRSMLALALLATAAVAGCALTEKGEALSIRYFTPESRPTEAGAASPAAASSAPAQAELRLGRVTSGSNMRERIAFRDAAHEVGYYDEQRWTERPEVFVRRRLEQALFEEQGLRHVVSGAAPTLEVEVVSFEELKLPGHHGVRVELRATLSDGRLVLLESTRAIERPLPPAADIEAVVAELSRALDVAADDVAARVAAALRRR